MSMECPADLPVREGTSPQERIAPMLSRFAAATVLVLATSAAWAGAGIESLDTVRVASGLTLPVFATHAP